MSLYSLSRGVFSLWFNMNEKQMIYENAITDIAKNIKEYGWPRVQAGVVEDLRGKVVLLFFGYTPPARTFARPILVELKLAQDQLGTRGRPR